MLVEQQVQLIKGGARSLPVVFLVHVAQANAVSQQLIECRHRSAAGLVAQAERQARQRAIELDFLSPLPKNWLSFCNASVRHELHLPCQPAQSNGHAEPRHP
jgi:hypothetical protein